MCENSELLLEAIKLHFRKAKQQELADELPSEPLASVELGVCSSKNYPSIRGQCEKCPRKTAISSLCEQLEKLAHITYFCWLTEGSVVKKNQEATGEEMAAMLEDLMIGTKMRCHMYNIYHQFSDLKFLKKFWKKMRWFYVLTFLRTTKTSNAMKYKEHILDMKSLQQLATSTELPILRASPAILIMILV